MIKLAIVVLGLLSWLAESRPVALTSPQPRVTLYSINKHRGQQRNFCINFQSVVVGRSPRPCDLRYGSLYVGNDLDWFESSGAQGNRSVIKDLGLKNWDQSFRVPVVEPLPKLKPGEQRNITIDSSGADGADGTPGAPGARGQDGADADGVVRSRSTDDRERAIVARDAPSRPKNDGTPRVDPMFVKAVVGHMYVIHVVDDVRDFYALFRVEALERGDNCTISWQLIQAPETSGNKPQR